MKKYYVAISFGEHKVSPRGSVKEDVQFAIYFTHYSESKERANSEFFKVIDQLEGGAYQSATTGTGL